MTLLREARVHELDDHLVCKIYVEDKDDEQGMECYLELRRHNQQVTISLAQLNQLRESVPPGWGEEEEEPVCRDDMM